MLLESKRFLSVIKIDKDYNFANKNSFNANYV